MRSTDSYLRPETVDRVEETATGLLAHLPGERLRIEPVRDDVVRIAISRGGVFDEHPTYAVCVDPLAAQPAYTVARDDSAGTVTLSTDALVLTLGLDPFRIDVHRRDGSVVIETATDGAGRPWAYATLNDAFTFRRRCRQEDAFFGLGEKTGRFNRRGRTFTNWNTDVLDPYLSLEFTAGLDPDDPRADRTSTEYDPYYVTIPFFYHQSGPSGAMSASFVDNGYRSHVDFAGLEEYAVQVEGGQYVEYVFAGPSMAEILEAYTWLTGRMAVPPLWALGYHQCRWLRYDQDEVEDLAARHRDLDLPCDAMWLDIEYMDGYRVFTWDRGLFPDPPAMLKRLSESGFKVITIIDPGVKHDPGYSVYDAAVEGDLLCRTEGGDVYLGQVWPGDTAFPDFATQEARDWWGELNAAHVASGLAGIWNDMNEPATGSVPPGRMLFEHGRASHERFHNQYALLMAMGTTAGLLKAMPDRRTFVLSRSGFAGIQRHAANWMGDNCSRWDHLQLSVAMGMGLGVSGQPFVGADIGGFYEDTGAELFLRWMQYGVLTPFARNHAMLHTVDQYAWSFGPAVLDLVRDAIRLRYRLMPYLYACFVQASETAAPIQRPLVYDHQDDPLVADIDDEFLLGGDLLVAPVSSPGVTSRQVYLPRGRWYDWHTGEVLEGGRFVIAATPMDRIPLYARGGAVIPMWTEAPASTAHYRPGAVELHLFVPADDGRVHRSLLQEDDGLTYAAADGGRVRTAFVVGRDGDAVTLSAEVEGDGYPEFARGAFHLVVHGADPESVEVDGAVIGRRDGQFVIANAGQPFTAHLVC